MPNSYHTDAQLARTKRLNQILRELPDFCSDYFLSVEQITSPLTRLSYAYDLKIFFQYCSDELAKFHGKSIVDFTDADLRAVTKQDIERYARYLSYYVKNEMDDGNSDTELTREYVNHEYGIKRKYASLRGLFKYMFAEGRIESDVASLVPLPKLHERAIIRLDIDEVARILDVAEQGTELPKTYQKYHKLTAKRDVALLSLFLGTGIRISECVGLNLDDFDFEQNAFVVTRKGGKEVILYFSDEVSTAVQDYIKERKEIETLPGHENACFLSIQRRRISQRAVENMVKKYASIAAPLKKKISPHKLRSTFGTNLYRETGDIYLVADVLGHSDVNTTRKHYAAMAEDHRRMAAEKTVLRSDN
ncbi:MAG: tyrosine-type recombinase/integrase [Clostridia bacterium]|nr:tyrosine-type recombinase/integrase [Clostridia bacterium]